MKILFLIVNLVIYLSLFKFRNFIASFLSLKIKPSKNSFHKSDSYLLGGILLIPSFFLTTIYLNYFLDSNLYFNFSIIFLFFILALIDDIFDLKPFIKIFFCMLILSVIINFDTSITLPYLNSYYFGLLNFTDNIFIIYFFPILCILLLVNAFNFIDGINGLASLIGLSYFIFVCLKNNHLIEYTFLLIPFLIIFIFINLKYSIFLGDSGNFLISIILSIFLLKENYYNPLNYFAEEIFLFLLIPGVDMLRLFIVRIKNKKNPFKGDLNHLHHLLFYKFKLVKTLIIFLCLVNFPIYLFYFFPKYLTIILIATFITYSFLVYKLSGNTNKVKKI